MKASTAIPPSCPTIRAPPRSGVSASRFRKPDWMSRARSVPAFMVAKSAPWMNGKARKNARNELVGKPGIFVAELRPAEVTARSAVGKTNGKMMFAGWRAVPGNRLDRRAADLRLELFRGALGDDMAVVDDPDAARERVGLLEVLGREEDGDAVLAREPGDLGPEGGPALHVEPGRRLVEEEDRRPVGEREREVEPALHAA